MLEWYRSYPIASDIAEMGINGSLPPHVEDNLPRLLISGYKYHQVEWPLHLKPGFCMLEWDMALDPMARRLFSSIALEEPREVLVAPYRFHDTWCMWIGNDGSGPSTDSRPVKVNEERCDSFGLGCIYFPNSVLTEFMDVVTWFSDATFGKWYHEKYGQARMTWKVHPQHLHEYNS